jgi:Leucine-rich repeat (LRR) protein
MKNVIILLLLAFCIKGYGQVINFPDANFKWALRTTVCADSDGDGIADADADFNNDGEINMNEALKIVRLSINERNISSLEGIQHFKNLAFLNCNVNQINNLDKVSSTNHPKLIALSCEFNKITKLNFGNFLNLISLRIRSNGISSLNLINLPKLYYLDAQRNNLKNLDVNNLPALEELILDVNQIEKLNISYLMNLKTFTCQYCGLKSIELIKLPNIERVTIQYNFLEKANFVGLTRLKGLRIYKNKLRTLELRNLENLEYIDCGDNEITSIIFENMPKLEGFECYNCKLEYMLLKTGSSFSNYLSFDANPNLVYICADDKNVKKIKDLSIKYGLLNCEVNSYCTFTPGGKFFILNGSNIFDTKNNGCNDIDLKLSNAKFNITNGTVSGTFISNATGNYSIPLQAGTHTITPILENPDYFEVTPTTFAVTFPSTSDTITQNFCITPKGIFRQTNITVIPLSPPARPGFDASYKIVWENVGNQIESGTLNFMYDETILDYISATQTADQIADGIVKWNFANLLPFEKREITVTLKVNRPTDTPAVNAGDKLYLKASILDNIFTLENTVVGSYDPNDKTCLQGDRVKPDMIGKYVDYLIRFENTGNYAAENVVIKDIIDTKAFDVSSLQITDASHEVYTRIEGNKVEFIFENIQLPFDDVNNDGYVAFKIKTLPSLVLGDSLKNLADIYFDYNFPIRTNEAQTTIALPVFTKDITTEVKIYPNPVTDILHLDTKENWTKAEIYDISGRIMRSVTLVGQSVDVSELESGTYFIKLKDGEKVGVVKFVKI